MTDVVLNPEDRCLLAMFKWRLDRNGYLRSAFNVNGEKHEVYLHRMLTNAGPGQIVDHINGVINDYRKSNLRLTDRRGNSRNRNTHANNKLGVKGVHFCKRRNRYYVQIMVDYRKKYVGVFKTIEEADAAYRRASIKYHGVYSRELREMM